MKPNSLRVIIAGSRNIVLTAVEVNELVEASGFQVGELVSGAAPGVDTSAEEWARLGEIPVRQFVAEWTRLGRKAGPIRNGLMAKYADRLIAVLGPDSQGTYDMIEQWAAERRPMYVVYRGEQ